MQSITPPLIAVIGAMVQASQRCVNILLPLSKKYGAAERVHLGKQAGNVGRSDKITVDGKILTKTIERNQVKTAKKLPGPVPALVLQRLSPVATALRHVCLSSSRVNCSNRPLSSGPNSWCLRWYGVPT